MAINRPQIVVQQSPLQTLFSQLPDMLLSFHKLKLQAEEAEKGRQHEESLIYLQDKITDKNRADQQNFELRQTAMKLGVLQPQEKTGPGGQILEDSLSRVQEYSADIEEDLNLYHKGLTAGSYLDVNKSGLLEAEEIASYVKELYPGGDVPEALTKGLEAWTLDPERRAALETAKLSQQITEAELLERKTKQEFLPESLRLQEELQWTQIETLREELKEKRARYATLPKTLEQEQELRDLEIKLKEQIHEKGIYEIDLLDFSLEEASLKNDQMRQALALGQLQLEAGEQQLNAATLQLDSDQFEHDVKLRENVIKTTGEALVGNLDAQVGIATGIMSNIKFRDQKGKLIPIMTLLTNVDEVAKEELKKKVMDSTYSTHIKEDVLDLMEAYYIGKGEDQIADYSIILDEVGKIQKLDEFYQEWVGLHKDELATYAISEGWDDLDNFMARLKAHNSLAMADLRNFANMYGSSYDVEKILKAIEWDQTGIFDNIDALDDATKAKEQFRHLSALQEQTQAQNLSAALLNAQPAYSQKDSSAILAPFDIMPLRSDKFIDDIFNLNDPDE